MLQLNSRLGHSPRNLSRQPSSRRGHSPRHPGRRAAWTGSRRCSAASPMDRAGPIQAAFSPPK